MFARDSHSTQRRAQYEAAVRAHASELYAFAFRVCGDRDVAEELVQETFYHAWKGLDALRKPESIRAWLFRILRRRHAHLRRDRSISEAAHREHWAAIAERDHHTASDPALRVSQQDAIQHALDKLDERYRIPILMVCLQGLTCRETAEQLDLPLGTILSRLHRARKHLEPALRDGAERSAPGRDDDGHQPTLRLGGGA